MSDSGANAERIAALLDGRLDERERSELLAQLALSDEDLEILAEAAAVMREMEEEDAAPREIPIGAPEPALAVDSTPPAPPPEPAPHIQPRRRTWGWMPIAAVLAGVAAAPLLWKLAHPADGDDPAAPVALLAAARGLPPSWAGTPWEATRSGGIVATPRGRAVRVGARLVDLRVAFDGGDEATVQDAVADVSALVRDLPGGDAVARSLEPAATSAERHERAAALSRGSKLAASLAGRSDAAAGAWVEALRLAAARQDTAFVRSAALRRRLDALAGDRALQPDAAEALSRARAAAGAGIQWPALEAAATDLLRALAR
jgi:hypothetical protein